MKAKKEYINKGWLPIFPGFYNTIFEGNEEGEIEYYMQETGNDDLGYDDIDFDYESYNDNAVLYCVDWVQTELNDLGFNIEVKNYSLHSPKYYNFSNDSINCDYHFNNDELLRVISYLTRNKEEFAKYIKDRYTSRSGFISSYSNDANDWIADLVDFDNDNHKFSSILQFILINELGDDLQMEMYYNIQDNYLIGTLKESV